MKKKSIYIGLGLIAVFIIVLLIGSYATTKIGGGVNVKNVTVGRDSFSTVPIVQGNYSFSVIYALANTTTNIYILNGTLLQSFSAYVGANSMNSGYSYISSKALNRSYVFHDNTSAVGVIENTKPNSSTLYYVVIDNTNGSPSSNQLVNASVLSKSYGYSQGFEYLGIFAVGVIALVAGVGFILYGLFKKEVSKEDDSEKAEDEKPKKKKSKKAT